MNQKENIDAIIDQYNSIRAQNIAMGHALSAMLSIFPEDVREQIAKHYDLRCANFQVIVNDGLTELDALAIQRKQFALVRERIFRAS